MLIDDEEIDQRHYRRILSRSGVVDEIHSFTMAPDALDFLRSATRKIDVIFLDINMPRMNGFEFLERASTELGDEFTDVVIIMLTTSLDPKDREKAARYQVVRDFLNKPLSIDHVQQVAKLLAETRS